MQKYLVTTIAVLPLLLSSSQAEQRWAAGADQPYVFSSEDAGRSSYLGVDIADINSDRLGALKLKEEQGVEVTMVDQDAPAGKAGIKEHDVILTMNGTPIESKTQLQRMIHETPAGRVVTLGVSRDGQPLTIKVQLADRRNEFAHMYNDKDWDKSFHVEIPPIPPIPDLPDFDVPNIGVVVVHSSMRSGLMVENITQQLGEFFGVKNGNGILVRSVEKGSQADKAGLRAGDVIIRVGDQPVHDSSDFTHALHARGSGSVGIAVVRDKKEQTLTISLPQRKDSGEMLEESVEAPEIYAQTQALTAVNNEIAQLHPQEFALEESQKAVEDLQKTLCDQQKEMTEQSEKLRREFGPNFREQFEKNRQKLEHHMEEFRRELSAESFDI